MLEAVVAGGIGLGAASFLVLGAAIGWFVRVPVPLVAGIMAFGAGALISTLAYELVIEANDIGGLWPTISGFLLGAVIYVVADLLLAQYGARRRKRSMTAGEPQHPVSMTGAAVAFGAVLDGIPESLVLGLSIAQGGSVSIPILLAVAVSNIPEGLSSSAGMKDDGRSARYVFGLWSSIALVSGVASLLGFVLLATAPVEVIAFVTTIAAGGILAMIANTMIPEAFAADRSFTGLWAALGFVLAFGLHELG